MVVHFLEQLHAWSGIGGNIVVEGRDFSSHHSLEDMAICWGDAFRSALGDKKGITRVASASMPMQGVLVTMSLDLSGRPFLTWITGIKSPMVEMLHHILHDMATHGAFDLNARLEYEGNNAIEDEHHLIETAGKTLGRVLREALEIKGTEIRSTKGVLS